MILLTIKALIVAEALRQGFDPAMAVSVAAVESQFNPAAIGTHGEIGLFQLRPQYSQIPVPMLLNPRLNAQEGIRQLKYWKIRCPIDNQFLSCYNSGKTTNTRYIKKVLGALHDI